MITTADKNELLKSTGEAVSQLKKLILSVDEDKVNTVPYEGSWTAPQLLTHVTKSISGTAQAMGAPGKPAERDPGQRMDEFKKIFLDFSIKMNSPEFIVPEDRIYEKATTIEKLEDAFGQLQKNAADANLTELVEDLPFGPTTKLEILYFTLVHTQRHLQQMERICKALKES